MWHGLRNDIIMRNVIYAEWPKVKSAPFFGANQFANTATVLMLQARHTITIAATKAHCSISTAPKILLAFISRAAWQHDTTWRKSSIEEQMFWKVTIPYTLIFSAKDVCTINVTVSFYLYLYLKPREKCFIFRRWDTWSWHNIQRWNGSCILFPWLRGSNPGNWVCVFFSFLSLPTVLAFFLRSNAHTHINKPCHMPFRKLIPPFTLTENSFGHITLLADIC